LFVWIFGVGFLLFKFLSSADLDKCSPLVLLYFLDNENIWINYLDHGVDIAFRASELCRVLDLDQHDEVEVMPHIVLALDVLLEADRLVVERRPVQACGQPKALLFISIQCIGINQFTANKAGVFQDCFFLLLFTPQIGESVNDDTKDQVQYNNDHDEEEEQVVHHSSYEQCFLK
jgi:hypothetical protein